MQCRICGAESGAERFTAREMMFGTREAFDYWQCDACWTLQIVDIPDDLARFYPPSYYSFNQSDEEAHWKTTAKRLAASAMVGKPGAFPSGKGLLAKIRRGAEPWTAYVAGLRRESAILDVGCGEGARLRTLARLGFTCLTGIDAFLPAKKAGFSGGVRLIAGELSEHQGRYDCITFHHSLEHVADPGALLSTTRKRLKPGGAVFVRIPLFQSEIWDEFGTNWAQIDPPRHLYLFTVQAFLSLASECGFVCERRGTDTMGWSLAWSHAYQRGLPMHNEHGLPNALPFSPEEMAGFEREAADLNAEEGGDQGYFVLRVAQ